MVALRDPALTRSRGYVASAWRRFRQNNLAVAGLIVFVVMLLFAYGAPLLSRYVTHQSYAAQNIVHTFAKPGETVTGIDFASTSGQPVTRSHWLGSDELGRDVLTRLAYGGRISVTVAFMTMALALTFGLLIGASAGYYGGAVDGLLMRAVDIVLSIPGLFLLILISAMVNNNVTLAKSRVFHDSGWLVLPIIIAAVSWTGLSRLVRGEFLALRNREFVDAARVIGASNFRIIWRHIMPNVAHVVVIWTTLIIPTVILSEASLSYLGFGVAIPTPSWGNMLTNATQYFAQSPYLVIVPGAAIYVTVLSVHLMGNGLRDALDPRLNAQ